MKTLWKRYAPSDPYWTMAIVVLLTALLVALVTHQRLRSRAEHARQEARRSQGSLDTLHSAVLVSHTVAYGQVGKVVTVPQSLEALVAVPESVGLPQAKLYILLSERDCNACQDSELRFANDLARDAGADRVVAVIHATERRYAASVVRVNAIRFRAFFDENDDFANQNGVASRPLLLAVNDRQEVVAAHLPLPGRPELSDAFHDACWRLIAGKAHAPGRRAAVTDPGGVTQP